MIKALKKYRLAIIFVFCSAIFSFFFYFKWLWTKEYIRIILESNFTYFFLWLIVILIFIIHYIIHKNKEVNSEPIISKKFGMFMDNLLGGVAYGTVISTSLTLLKGLFIQKFFNDKIFFMEFESLDLLTIFGVGLFLLYNSVVKVVDVAKETWKVENTETVYDVNGKVVKKN